MFPIGVLDVLQKPVVAFVRLSDSVVMQSALESPVPVRFVFVLVGPSQSEIDYSESGRAMGALMADWVRERRMQRHSSMLLQLRMDSYFAHCRCGKEFSPCSRRCSAWRLSWPRLTKI